MAIFTIVPRRAEDFFDRDGNPTLRFVNWMEEVTNQGNDESTISDKTIALAARVESLLKTKGLIDKSEKEIKRLNHLSSRIEALFQNKGNIEKNKKDISRLNQLWAGD